MSRIASFLGYGLGVRRMDWQPMERHPRPLRRRNPTDMGIARMPGIMLRASQG